MEKRLLAPEEQGISPEAVVKVTTMKHIVEIQYLEKVNTKAHIRKLDSERYIDLETGEIRAFERTDNRGQGENSLRKTFNRLRELINTNFTGSPQELFVTLTYRGELQTNDTKRVYEDFKNFMKRLKYKYKKTTTIDYINVLEPHATGNFHMHVLLRFNDLENIYIPNTELAKLWGNGFVTVQSLQGVDNIGAYLSAYLADIEIPEDNAKMLEGHPDLVEKEVSGQKKKFMKGARLVFYPTGVNIYRKSKGIVEAEKEKMSYKNAQKKLGAATPNFKYGVELIDNEKDFRNTLIKEQYNL
ncbi:rolling circle replication-associated protein, partial [Bacillus velezensis]|uniref:rolling circle replication-associated protein n=2 Tax=Bacillales TaxID=1385 RepID=UPI00111E4984